MNEIEEKNFGHQGAQVKYDEVQQQEERKIRGERSVIVVLAIIIAAVIGGLLYLGHHFSSAMNGINSAIGIDVAGIVIYLFIMGKLQERSSEAIASSRAKIDRAYEELQSARVAKNG